MTEKTGYSHIMKLSSSLKENSVFFTCSSSPLLQHPLALGHSRSRVAANTERKMIISQLWNLGMVRWHCRLHLSENKELLLNTNVMVHVPSLAEIPRKSQAVVEWSWHVISTAACNIIVTSPNLPDHKTKTELSRKIATVTKGMDLKNKVFCLFAVAVPTF